MNYNTNAEHNESRFPDLQAQDEITTQEEIREFLGDVIIIDRFTHNYDYLFDRVVDVAVMCWNNTDRNNNKLQHTFIKFKRTHDDNVTYELPLNRFMVSLVFIRTIIEFLPFINMEDFILTDFMSKKIRIQIQNKIVQTLTEYGKTIIQIQEIMSHMSLELKHLLLIFSQANMELFTAENLFLEHYKNSPIIQEINNTYYPSTMQTADIVEQNKLKYQQLEKEMLSRNNPFFVYNKYTPIIKPKQMEELYINFSQIPDGENIVPVIMNGNGFKAGYHEIPVMYAGAIAARVPDIMNEKYMGLAGYFARNVWMLTYGTLSRTVFDCGSINPIKLHTTDSLSELLDGRYYTTSLDDLTYKVFSKDDLSLRDKDLFFRSPCTCNLNEDVCHMCYGTKALKVGDLNGGFVYTSELLTKDVGQKVLSAKHLLKTDAEKIDITPNYEKYFTLENSTLIPTDEHKFDIYFKEDYLDDIQDQLTIYVTKDLIPITISNYASISIPEEIEENLKEVVLDDVTYFKISSSTVLNFGIIVSIIPKNIMMTQRYMEIMNLIETNITRYNNISDVVETLSNLTYKIIPILSVHNEIIISHLIRSTENKLLRPDWTQPSPSYELVRLKTALTNHESVTVALAFEQTRHHILHSIFNERNEIKRVGPRSFEDFLFGIDTM